MKKFRGVLAMRAFPNGKIDTLVTICRRRRPLVPKLCLGMQATKLCFARGRFRLKHPFLRVAVPTKQSFVAVRSQAELGDEEAGAAV